jgi:heat shock protein HtpX
MIKRVFLFLLVNLLIILTISVVMNVLNIQPFLNKYGIDYRSLILFCLAWGMGGSLISLMLSKITAKWIMGVTIIDPMTHDPALHKIYKMVERLSQSANLPCTPEVGIFNSDAPNAFATGPTKKRSLVALSTGLIHKMQPGELEAIIGHEIAHIANGDMVTMTLLQGIINAFVMFLARILAFAIARGSKNDKESSSFSHGSYYLFVYLFEIVFMILGSIVICFYSRKREYRADLGGAKLSSFSNMISALNSLEKKSEVFHKVEEKPALQAFMIYSKKTSIFSKLFSTHPPIAERVKHLQEKQYSI